MVGLKLMPNKVQSCCLVGKVGDLVGGGPLSERLSTRYHLDMLSKEAEMIMGSDAHIFQFNEVSGG